jgi:hypothetical protein
LDVSDNRIHVGWGERQYRDLRAFRRKEFCRGTSDAPAGTGDDSHFSG